ncbi:t-SNARE [Dipodascopsis uninucleata]
MYRDRTSLYYSFRQSYARHPATESFIYSTSSPFGVSNGNSSKGANVGTDEARNPLLNDRAEIALTEIGDNPIELDILPPSWTDISDEVNQILDMIKEKSVKLDRLHQEHILPGFDDRSQQEIKIEHLTAEITQHFRECQRLIRSLESLANQPAVTSAQVMMSKNMQISLATKVQDLSSQFRKKQSAYLRKLRENQAASLSVMSTHSSSPYPENDLDISFSQSQIQESVAVSRSSNDAVIRQRESEIALIAQGIIELADIFKELQTMIIDQGTILDRIDYNIENTKVHVKAADKELQKASGYQKRSQKCKIIFFLSLLIFLLLVIIFFKFQGRKSQYERPPISKPEPEQPQTQIDKPTSL